MSLIEHIFPEKNYKAENETKKERMGEAPVEKLYVYKYLRLYICGADSE